MIVPHPPPNWDLVQTEKAIQFVFDWETKLWSETVIQVKFDATPFAKGALRLVHYLLVRGEIL
jgi:hypothetical protein